MSGPIDATDPVSFPEVSPIFVVGAPRSGTTLLQLILNEHPDVAIHGEIHFFNTVLQLRREIPSLANADELDRLFDQLGRLSSFQYLPGLEERLPEVRRRMKASGRASYELFFKSMLEVFGDQSGAKHYGEKTPENVRYLPSLRSLFPRARFVHIVRDPRGVVASLMRMPWAPTNIAINALKWKIDILYAREFLMQGGSMYELRYEDLVARPEQVLRNLCQNLAIDWQESMLNFSNSADANIRNEPWKEGTRRSINAGAVCGWRSQLDPGQVKVIEQLTRPFLKSYGYVPESGRPLDALTAAMRAGIDLLRYGLARTYSQQQRRLDHPEVIFGDEHRLREKLPDALLTWRI